MANTSRNDLGPLLRNLAEAEPGCEKALDFNERFYKAFPCMRKDAGGKGPSSVEPNFRADRDTEAVPCPNIKPGVILLHVETGLDVTVLRDWGGNVFTVKFPSGQLGIYGANAFTPANLPKANVGGLTKALAKRIGDDPSFARAFAQALDEPAFGRSFTDRIDRLKEKIMALDVSELKAL